MKENICVVQLAPPILLHLAPSSIFEFFVNSEVNEQRKVNKTWTDKTAHARKSNILVAFNVKKYCSNLAENSKSTYYHHNQFLVGTRL